MSEWLKILISTLAGLAAGLFAEPLKERLVRDVRINRIKRGLNAELMGMIFAAQGFVENAPKAHDYHYFQHASLEYYKMVSTSDRASFVQLSYAIRYVELFNEAERLKNDDRSAPEETVFRATQFLRRCYLYSSLFPTLFTKRVVKYIARELDRPPFNDETALRVLMGS